MHGKARETESAFTFFQYTLNRSFQAHDFELRCFRDRAKSGYEARAYCGDQKVLRRPQAGLTSEFWRSREINGAGDVFGFHDTGVVRAPVGGCAVAVVRFHGS